MPTSVPKKVLTQQVKKSRQIQRITTFFTDL